MNVALSTVVLLILLIPGFLFRRFYYTAEFSKEYFKESFTELLFTTLVPSVLLHLLAYTIFVSWHRTLDVVTLSTLLTGTKTNEVVETFGAIQRQSWWVTGYLSVVSAIGALGGASLKALVRRKKLDRRYKPLRFRNEWHYLFSGEMLDFPNIPGEAVKVDFRFVDVLVNTSEGDVIYSGNLVDYVLSKGGSVERLYLDSVHRRYLRNDVRGEQADADRYYEIPGEFMVIPFDKVINLNITYYQTDPVAPEA